MNLDFAPDLYAHDLLQRACLATVESGGRAAFIAIPPAAVKVPRTHTASSIRRAADIGACTDVETADGTGSPSAPFNICALFDEPRLPDLIVAHGLDYLFQNETPYGTRMVKATPALAADTDEASSIEVALDDEHTSEEETLRAEKVAVAEAGFCHVRSWLAAYIGMSRMRETALWIACSHGHDLNGASVDAGHWAHFRCFAPNSE